ncbi:MAG: hypothetical protein IPP80_11475 [Ignavibacteria bacterium]|nr:hypothetical protein [Ignavibacteria bacterium]MBL0322972.1 hypothetical protein [Ignavibacteria bacterium]
MKTLVTSIILVLGLVLSGTSISAQKWVRYSTISGASFQDLAVSIVDPQIIVTRVQGTAYPYYTTNGGTTWQQFRELPDVYGSTVSWLSIVSGTKQTVRMLFDRYIVETSNFGESWTTVSTLPSSNFSKLLVHPTRTNLWFAMGVAKTLLRSSNAGQKWDTVYAANQYGASGLLMSPATPSRMYLEDRDTLYESADTGRTWQRFSYTGVMGYSIALLAADATTADRLYAYFQGRIAISTDRGRTWSDRTLKNVMTVSGILQAPNNSSVLFAWGTDLHQSTDQGMSWRTIDTTHTARLSATVVDGQLYVGCYQSGIFRTAGMGQGWTRLDNNINRLEVRNLIRYSDTRWYMQGVNDVAFTTNAGVSWTYLTPVKYEQPSGGRVYSFDVALSDPSKMLGGTNSDIYRSNDGGTTWQGASPMQNEPIDAISIHQTNPLEIVCGGLYNLKHSTDGGVTWKNDLVNNARSIVAIGRNPKAPSHIVAADANVVYSTLDGGNSWTKNEGWLNSTEQIIGDANDGSTFYASNYTGIRRSTDNGTTWHSPWTYAYGIRAFVQDPRNSDVFIAAPTNGRGQIIRLVRSTGVVDTIYQPGWEDESFNITSIMVAGNTIIAGSQSGLIWFDPTPVSVDEDRAGNQMLTMAPNPANDYVQITYNPTIVANVRIEVSDLQGITLRTSTVDAVQLRLGYSYNLDGLPAGVLLLKLVDGDRHTAGVIMHVR